MGSLKNEYIIEKILEISKSFKKLREKLIMYSKYKEEEFR